LHHPAFVGPNYQPTDNQQTISLHQDYRHNFFHELLPYHQITGIFGVTEPWGNFSSEVSTYQYLHDSSKYRFSLELDFSWRVLEGLFLRFSGNASLIKNQISLAKSTGTAEEILLSGRQLPTTFRYGSSFGLNYTFGSINNNVVNPRFSGVD
jgi:hypothetical protein